MPHIHEAPENSRFQKISAGGVNLRVFTRDLQQAGVPLVICNGLGQSVEILYPLLQELPGRPIIAFDAAGAGRSDVPDDMTTIPRHASMLTEILDHLGVGQCDVMGISWGGAVAQQIAYDRPDRVRKLVLAITSAGGIASWWGSPIALSEIMFPWRYMNKAYGDFIGPFMYGGEALLQPALFREYSRLAIRPTYKGYAAQVQALCSWSSLPWLANLTMPTQVIGGALDTLIPIANQMLLASLIPNARLKAFPAGHLLMYSRRSEVGDLMTDFLDN
ncbi:alpha/beta fold hydrolase [Sedimentitalea nanhaiensis]|uniref:Pimeloyl-ACP methyl ester carboxylesterase n=1 Tax=Sedimentitalea nanhaiensis TaxID=999627 RepID=A0A1I7EA86_9RHOB|nr:alpha/beta hydrolase [Sedimentitalea nanhaiensis]SFU20848.1 Pimeloyl-ACP methyl ester carboxylesterase [Sedimentitalea nanhaiensis]